MNRLVFTLDNTLQVFISGKSVNKKIIGSNDKIVQSYTYSIEQYNYVRQQVLKNESTSLKQFFSLDSKNCFDCPFSISNGNGGCYTHKFNQYMGIVGQLKSIVRQYGEVENIPTFDNIDVNDFITLSSGKYVRFGSYGEPSMHPIGLVEAIAEVSKNWTGYTHQYFRKPQYSKFFMASVHNVSQAKVAKEKFGYRSFISSDNKIDVAVTCPASKEANKSSTCEKCGLCSGTLGKGKKDIQILLH
jgi:hypothetical protein